jgi:two-component system response regulator AlgR
MDELTGKMTEAWQVILRDCKDRLPVSRRLWPSIKALVK